MRSFTTNAKFEVTENTAEAMFLFEHLESYANGKRFLVQRKNENGKWGGRGDDVQFTIHLKSPTKTQVVAEFLRSED